MVKYDNDRPTDTLTLKSGASAEFRLSIESDAEITLEWMGQDQYDNECSFIVMKENRVVIYMSPALSPSTSFLCSWVNDCSCKNEYQEMCEAVNNLRMEATTITWEAPEKENISHYEIYRDTRFLGITEELSFVDETALFNKLYCYSVRPVYEDCFGLFKTIDVTFNNEESVNEMNSNIKVNIYPNPSNADFNITCDNMTYVSVYNVVGNKIMEANVIGNNYIIEGLDSGIYFVEIKTLEGNIVKRILKF